MQQPNIEEAQPQGTSTVSREQRASVDAHLPVSLPSSLISRLSLRASARRSHCLRSQRHRPAARPPWSASRQSCRDEHRIAASLEARGPDGAPAS